MASVGIEFMHIDRCLQISVNTTENILQTAQYWEHGAQTNSPACS